jgi:hypothetical protein
MLSTGIPPSVIENVLQYEPQIGNLPNTLQYYDPVNNVRVILNAATGKIITLGYGTP